MIKFEFELSDIDAENLFGCIQDSICYCYEMSMQEQSSADNLNLTKFYQKRIEYLNELKLKLHNTKV